MVARNPAAGDERPVHWFAVGTLEDIPPAGARIVATGWGDIALFRTGDDRVYALLDRCPHRGGPLSQGLVCGRRVVCPLHNWAIELDSGAAAAPDEGHTRTYPVRLEAGTLYLGLPAPVADG